MRAVIGVVCVMLLAGCAGVPPNAPTYSPAPAAPAGHANVYVYRIGAYPTLRTPTISIDGKAIFDPPERSYTVVPLPEGLHAFNVDWAWDTGWPDLDFPIAVDSGPLFIKISGSFAPSGAGSYQAGSYAQKVDPSVAESEMTKCCRYLAPKK